MKLTKSDIRSLAEQIPKIFPQELSETYFIVDGKTTGGVLYSKYFNKMRVVKQNVLLNGNVKKRKLDADEGTRKDVVVYSKEEIAADEFVRTNRFEGSEKFMVQWKCSSRYRKMKILVQLKGMEEILKEYPVYGMELGDRLVRFWNFLNFRI